MTAVATRRSFEIDALRGLMLVLMTLTHLPSRLTDPFGQPFGFVSAAEGFVLLSAYVAGLVYSRVAERQGLQAMGAAFRRRALKVYLCQGALLLFLFTVVRAMALHGEQAAVKDLMSFFLEHPGAAFVQAMLLVYEPALLDILPMYVVFLLLSPLAMRVARAHGWLAVMLPSAAFWLAAQFGLSEAVHAFAMRHLGLRVPFQDVGAFNLFAWQLLWFAGLALGAGRQAPGAAPLRFPAWVVTGAAMVAVYVFVWRHFGLSGQAPFGADEQLNRLFDKWLLGPLRLLDLAALCVLAIRFGPGLAARLPRLHALEQMGSASLAVFCAHLVAVLLVLGLQGSDHLARSAFGDAMVLAGVFAGLYLVARVALWWGARKPRWTQRIA